MSLRLALRVAERSQFKQRLGAVIVAKGGRVISTGFNQTGRYTAKLKQEWDGSMHAEMAAILKVLSNPDGLSLLSGATIFVARLSKRGTAASAYPCLTCQNLIKSVDIKRIIAT